METIDNRTFKEKVEAVKAKAKEKAEEAKKWVVTHTEEIVIGATIILPIVGGIAKEVVKASKDKEERIHRERDIYDPRKGRTYRLKRTPKPWEWDEIDFRYEQGEMYSSILHDMNLI